MVVISHDRHFLNTVCTHILDLDFKTIREFSGNYDDWYIASTLIAKQQEMERNKKLKEKEELENLSLDSLPMLPKQGRPPRVKNN
ncbi:ABC transporter ATP-binding protein [Helicobacter mustelae]|nr:ABC transporter ATP-binding protein [Helicobacter mustelae]